MVLPIFVAIIDIWGEKKQYNDFSLFFFVNNRTNYVMLQLFLHNIQRIFGISALSFLCVTSTAASLLITDRKSPLIIHLLFQYVFSQERQTFVSSWRVNEGSLGSGPDVWQRKQFWRVWWALVRILKKCNLLQNLCPLASTLFDSSFLSFCDSSPSLWLHIHVGLKAEVHSSLYRVYSWRQQRPDV